MDNAPPMPSNRPAAGRMAIGSMKALPIFCRVLNMSVLRGGLGGASANRVDESGTDLGRTGDCTPDDDGVGSAVEGVDRQVRG